MRGNLRGSLGSQTAALQPHANPVGVCLAALVWLAGMPAANAQEMPNRFVYLHDVDPIIVQDMRYASANNFTGQVVPGYAAPECLLVREAADALKAVQAELTPQGLSLKVYDCYRPARAVAAFVAWAKQPDDPHAKAVHYPALDKAALFPGYIATRSGHSRGATMDLTLVPFNAPAEAPAADGPTDAPCTAPRADRAGAASLDMGTSFDCFDRKANTFVPGLTQTQRANRALLLDAMARHGFKNYDQEWWHFTLENEPYPGTIFDFPILPREAKD
jgi:D-alanyl-D-alanine dipeptidase